MKTIHTYKAKNRQRIASLIDAARQAQHAAHMAADFDLVGQIWQIINQLNRLGG